MCMCMCPLPFLPPSCFSLYIHFHGSIIIIIIIIISLLKNKPKEIHKSNPSNPIESMQVVDDMIAIATPTKTSVTITEDQSDSPNWKLYDNPHYTCGARRHHNSPRSSVAYTCISRSRSSHRASDIAAFSARRPMLDRHVSLSDLDDALAEIRDLRSEIEFERRMRAKVEALNKAMMRQLEEERRRRDEAEERGRRLEEEVTCARREILLVREEVEEERRMLRVAELMREERVQMKLSDARILMEERMREMDGEIEGKSGSGWDDQRGANHEVENPHIRRGMKGMEFPKAVRVRVRGNRFGLSPRRGRELGTDLECQRAQLRVLIRNRNLGGGGGGGRGIMGGNAAAVAAESLVM